MAAVYSLLLVACEADKTPADLPLPEPDGLPALIEDGPLSPRIANYEIDVEYMPAAHELQATMRLSWTNTASRPARRLPFHLYLNAFKNSETVFMKESRGRMRSAKAKATGWGWIDITSVEVNGKSLLEELDYPGPDETVVWLPLESAVEPGDQIEVEMAFRARLPIVFARTGYQGDFAMVGQWFPKIGVLEGAAGSEEWECEPFHAMSEFYADFGTYDVTITAPRTHLIAATGVLVSARDLEDDRREHVYRAEDVHDFAWMADPFMEVLQGSARVGDRSISVRVYYRGEQRAFARRHLQAGIGAIEAYSELYRPYPWSIMRIVDPPIAATAGAGGMEYPTLVTTAGDSIIAPPGVREPEFVTIHEVGHNWFPMMLATNEVETAWMDEGLNSYTNGVVMRQLYGRATSIVDWGGYHADVFEAFAVIAGDLSSVPDPIDRSSFRFSDYQSYGAATYAKTALVFATLEGIYGSERFRAAMRAYAREFAFQHPGRKDLIRTLERELGADIEWFLAPALDELGAVDLRVRTVDCHQPKKANGFFGRGEKRQTSPPEDKGEPAAWSCEVVVENLGSIPVPVDVELTYESGQVETHRWDDRGRGNRWHRLVVAHTTPVETVQIDPEGAIPLNVGGIHSSYRRTPKSAPVRRAGARAHFWTQTAMQVFGL